MWLSLKNSVMNRAWKAFWGVLLVLGGCSVGDPAVQKASDFTGNEITYPLASASEFNISGSVTLKERKDGSTTLDIVLNGMEGTEGLEFPVHLHNGNVATDNAEIAAVLQPVSGKSWKSSTVLKTLTDESAVKFDDLKNADACIKIHFAATGINKDIILSAGNIGKATDSPDANGRFSVAVCKSE
jgi:hypothetical protein